MILNNKIFLLNIFSKKEKKNLNKIIFYYYKINKNKIQQNHITIARIRYTRK